MKTAKMVFFRMLSGVASVCLAVFFVPSAAVYAHQPVMDMAPRWKGGWGYQVRYESRRSSDLYNGSSKIANPFGLSKTTNSTWLEGVYTKTREFRVSAKLPYVEQTRTILQNGAPVRQSSSGIGDLELALLLKRYENKKSSTGNIAMAPMIRIPTGSTSDLYPISDGSIDFGLSFSKSTERAKIYQYYDLSYWINNKGERGSREGNELKLDVNIGYHPYHDNLKNQGVFVMVDAALRHQQAGRDDRGSVTGGQRLEVGPVLVLYRGGVMLRGEYRYPIYERVRGTQLSHGPRLNLGAGFVF